MGYLFDDTLYDDYYILKLFILIPKSYRFVMLIKIRISVFYQYLTFLDLISFYIIYYLKVQNVLYSVSAAVESYSDLVDNDLVPVYGKVFVIFMGLCNKLQNEHDFSMRREIVGLGQHVEYENFARGRYNLFEICNSIKENNY